MTGSLSHAANCPKQVGKSASPGSFLYNSSWHTNHTSVGQKAYCDLTIGMEIDFTGPISENSAVAAVASFTAATYRWSQVIGSTPRNQEMHRFFEDKSLISKIPIFVSRIMLYKSCYVYRRKEHAVQQHLETKDWTSELCTSQCGILQSNAQNEELNIYCTRKYVESLWIDLNMLITYAHIAHILHAHTYKVHYHKAFPFQAILPFSYIFSSILNMVHGYPRIKYGPIISNLLDLPWTFRTSCRSFGSVRSISLVSRLKVPTICQADALIWNCDTRFESFRLPPCCNISCMKWKKHGECFSMTQKKQKIWTAQNSNCELHSLLSLLHRNKLTRSPQLFHPVPFLGPTWKTGTSRKKNVTKKK